ncbi:hypothetical protein C8A05DRAFT_36748 [Staphylotrichum tortipilum]|uniref:Uncharacterized protein n=1 Tax=Staphylotrichum tortipilum TaxID=2831512 RepID=A0AAN6MF35_9PEZI|nr:hypothetical protein C8A05DRAFT_36748 [Staphylotrichum longicolle]
MKATFLFTVIGLAATAAATPFPGTESQPLAKRCPNSGSTNACNNACNSVAISKCASCGGNPSCMASCVPARTKICVSCCASSCTTC